MFRLRVAGCAMRVADHAQFGILRGPQPSPEIVLFHFVAKRRGYHDHLCVCVRARVNVCANSCVQMRVCVSVCTSPVLFPVHTAIRVSAPSSPTHLPTHPPTHPHPPIHPPHPPPNHPPTLPPSRPLSPLQAYDLVRVFAGLAFNGDNPVRQCIQLVVACFACRVPVCVGGGLVRG